MQAQIICIEPQWATPSRLDWTSLPLEGLNTNPHCTSAHTHFAALQDGLRQTSPRLHELAAGKGRPAQLSARLLKSLEKCWT